MRGPPLTNLIANNDVHTVDRGVVKPGNRVIPREAPATIFTHVEDIYLLYTPCRTVQIDKMPYRKKYTAKRRPTMAAKKRPRRKAPARKAPPRRYRASMASTIQMANLKPSSANVRFEAKRRYVCSATAAGVPNKSILVIPASYLGNPQIQDGVWNLPPGAAQFVPTLAIAAWFPRYNHYKVLGARITVAVKPYSSPDDTQPLCMLHVSRVADLGIIPTTVTNDSLEASSWTKSSQFGSTPGTDNYRESRLSQGYSPRRQLNIKDVKDADNLRCTTTYNTPAGENTYFNIVIGGLLDYVAKPHEQCIVDVKMDYLVAFEEPSQSNIPTLS